MSIAVNLLLGLQLEQMTPIVTVQTVKLAAHCATETLRLVTQ